MLWEDGSAVVWQRREGPDGQFRDLDEFTDQLALDQRVHPLTEAVSPDGRYRVIGDSDRIRIVELGSGDEIVSVDETSAVSAVAWNSRGDAEIMVGFADGRLERHVLPTERRNEKLFFRP